MNPTMCMHACSRLHALLLLGTRLMLCLQLLGLGLGALALVAAAPAKADIVRGKGGQDGVGGGQDNMLLLIGGGAEGQPMR